MTHRETWLTLDVVTRHLWPTCLVSSSWLQIYVITLMRRRDTHETLHHSYAVTIRAEPVRRASMWCHSVEKRRCLTNSKTNRRVSLEDERLKQTPARNGTSSWRSTNRNSRSVYNVTSRISAEKRSRVRFNGTTATQRCRNWDHIIRGDDYIGMRSMYYSSAWPRVISGKRGKKKKNRKQVKFMVFQYHLVDMTKAWRHH